MFPPGVEAELEANIYLVPAAEYLRERRKNTEIIKCFTGLCLNWGLSLILLVWQTCLKCSFIFMKHCFTHWPWEGTASSVRSCGLYLDFAATTPKISECEEETPYTFYHTFLTMMLVKLTCVQAVAALRKPPLWLTTTHKYTCYYIFHLAVTSSNGVCHTALQ